jgi:hypothetical protein
VVHGLYIYLPLLTLLLDCKCMCPLHTSDWLVVGVGLVSLARKYGISMSAAGICVDFLQVVSLFSSFGFAWPPQLTALFKAASASTVNDQLVCGTFLAR